jgi:hypothetical protein
MAISHFAYLLVSNTNTLTKMRDLRVIAFYEVCRNLKVEQALKKIWPSYVIKIDEGLAYHINKILEHKDKEP